MVKAVFFDVDGTLLSFKTHKVPESALQSLQQLKEKGIKIFVSSGRPHYLLDSLKNIEFDGYVTLNGSHSFIPGGETLLKKNISSDDIRSIIEWSRQVSYPLVFMHADGWFAPAITPEIREITDHLEVDLPEVLPIEEALGKDIFQIMGFFPGSLDSSVQENVFSGCTITRWHPLFCDIVCKGNDKQEGIIRVMEHHGFDVSQSMAFGDGGNDINMLKTAGIGVAMGNAGDEVKSVADYVTSSVDEDGIRNALVHFGLID